jgi:uncharacterized protein with HEPN domain
MSRHSPEVRLRPMLDHAREAVDVVTGKSRTDLANTRLLQLGLVRLVEIIGEAAASIPREERAKYPMIPWDKVSSADLLFKVRVSSCRPCPTAADPQTRYAC